MNKQHQNELIIGEGLGVGELAYKEVLRPMGGAAGAGIATVTKLSLHGMEDVGLRAMTTALPVALIFGLLSVWDHKHEMRVLRSEFECEIGAQLGKPAEQVTIKDMEEVARHNPIIAEAINRSRKQRNLNIFTTTVCTVASLAATLFLGPAILAMPAIAGAIMGGGVVASAIAFLVPATLGFLTFVGGEKALEYAGTKMLHLDEPPIRAVELSPNLQSELSVANQIRMLSRAQARRKPISEMQVLTVFLSANPSLQREIAGRYGAPFARLPDPLKMRVLNDVAPALNISQLTQDINNEQIRVQELAFAVVGKASGVERLQTPQQAKLAVAQEKLMAAEAKIATLTHTAGEKTGNLAHKLSSTASHIFHIGRRQEDKMAMRNASVSGVIPQNQNVAKVASEGRDPNAAGSKTWAERSQAAPTTASIAAG